MIRRGQQSGYILLTVIVTITLVAAIALMMNYESAIETSTTGSEFDSQQARYVTEAGLNHALWQTTQQGCGTYSNLSSVSFGNDQYSSSLITDIGSTSNYSVSVDQDTYIESDSPTNNNDSATVLEISNNSGVFERPMYRFNLTPIPVSAPIISATAWFYVIKEHPQGLVDIHRITADWTETDATWDSMGANIDSTLLASIPAQPAPGVWVSVNLTAPVQAWVNGQPNFGIMLNSTATGVDAEYASRESANPPYLEVVVGTPPTPVASLKSVGTLANGVSRSIVREVVLQQGPMSYSQLQPDAVDGEDAEIWDQAPNNNYGAVAETWVSSATNDTTRSLLRFNMGAIPHGAKIMDATLSLRRQSGSGANQPVSAHRIRNPWSEDSVSWNQRETGTNWDTAGADFDIMAVTTTPVGPVNQRYEWLITSLVQGWVDGSYPNYGVALVAAIAGMAGERFYTSDDADPTRWPSLSITYACECGQACLAPQGSGKIALIGDDSSPDPDDQLKIEIIESWGYEVDFYQDQDSGSIIWSNYDLAYVSETVISGDVNANLTNLSIGVVNEEPKLYDDLQLANGYTAHVGSSIDITDNSHFISAIFPLGPLSIYDADMEILTADTPLAGGLQTLGEYSGAASLTAIDQGAPTTSGTAAGRRVTLPFGQHFASNFNWTQLNNNGRLIVQRALQWGAEVAGAANTLILSTLSAASLGGLSFDDLDLAEYDMDADIATLFLDGGPATLNNGVIALHLLANGHLVLASNPGSPSPNLGGLTFAAGDLVDYDPVADSATLIFDGAALFSDVETIIAVHVLDNGNLVLATETDATLGGLSFTDRDLVEYDPSTDTASLFFDGSLTTLNGDITALHVLENGHLILAVRGSPNSTLGGLSFAAGDLVDYDPVAGTAVLFFEAATRFSSSDEELNSVHIGPGSGSL